jgi:hypothetical protein
VCSWQLGSLGNAKLRSSSGQQAAMEGWIGTKSQQRRTEKERRQIADWLTAENLG